MNQVPDVLTLPQKELEPHLERQRYTALTIPRLDLGRFLVEILSKANDFVPSEAGSFLMDRPGERLVGDKGPDLYFLGAYGPSANSVLGRVLNSSDGIIGRVYRTGEPYLMIDPATDSHFFGRFDEASNFKTTGVIAVPIRIEQTVCGVLELVNRKSATYTSQDVGILEVFGAYTSAFLENLLDARRASEMARRDDLSSLYNDRFFHHRLTEDLIRADVKGAEVALLFLDLDNFKAVNDTLGHLAGSQVLKEFAVLLSQAVDVPEATLARYGGDEFVVILPGFSAEEASKVGERICVALRGATFLRGSFTWADGPVSLRSVLTVSVGVAVYPMHLPRTGSTDLKKNLLMRAADLAMYRAKEDGKDRVVVAPVSSP